MRKTFYASMLVMAWTVAALAQTAGDRWPPPSHVFKAGSATLSFAAPKA